MALSAGTLRKRDNTKPSLLKGVMFILAVCSFFLLLEMTVIGPNSAFSPENLAMRVEMFKQKGGFNSVNANGPDSTGSAIAKEAQFAYQDMRRQRCLSGIQKKLRNTFQPYFEKYPGGVALIDVVLHTNLGDNVLWKGAMSLLADFGISPQYVCYLSQPAWKATIDSKAVKCTVDNIIEVVKNRGLVLLQPGGNWGSLYRLVQTPRVAFIKRLHASAQKYRFGIVQLPQGIFYEPNSKWLEIDSADVKKFDPKIFTLFSRSQEGYDFAKANYGNTSVKLSPDIAFALGPMTPIRDPTYDILIMRRQDGEGSQSGPSFEKWVDEQCKGANVTYYIRDWWYHSEEHPREISGAAFAAFAEVRTAAANQILSEGKVIITDRLHGSIVATLLGKHLFYVDTPAGKLTKTRDNAFSESEDCRPEYLHASKKETFEQAVEAAIELLQTNRGRFIYN